VDMNSTGSGPELAERPGTTLILKRAPVGNNQDDYSVLEEGVVVGRIFKAQVAPEGRPWMWASGHSADSVKRAAHGYEATARGCDGGVRQELAAANRPAALPPLRRLFEHLFGPDTLGRESKK
jgi:hypothetical protein